MVISEKFTLNGIEGFSKNMYIVTFDSDVLINKGIPFSRNINSIDGYSQFNPMFRDEDTPPDDIILNFMYIENNMPQIWDEEKILDVKKWIITDDFIPFTTQDNPNYIYYLMCKKIQNKMTPEGLGVLECTFTPFSHFAYNAYNSTITVKSSKNIVIDNPSIYSYEPIIKIKNLGNEETVNKIGDLEVTGLATNEKVTIDNIMLTVINENNENRFSKCNRNWVSLSPGENIVPVSGNCEIEILCEFPISL